MCVFLFCVLCSTCGFNLCFLLPPTPLLPFTEICGHQRGLSGSKQVISFWISHHVCPLCSLTPSRVCTAQNMRNCFYSAELKESDHPGQDTSMCLCAGDVSMDQPVNRTYISNISRVYCPGFRSATFMLITCFSGIK